MSNNKLPRYPIYIPSKSRYDTPYTAEFLERDGIPYRMVVEDQEHDEYAKRIPEKNLLVLPFQNRGSVIPARNWIKEHSISEGHIRHWQLDDNIQWVERWYHGKRIKMHSRPAFRAVEDFTDRYENIALSGMNYVMFGTMNQPPFHLNSRVYSCMLALNAIPHRWRGRYNEDADICLQVLADGWCTVLINAFLVKKRTTMKTKGGNTKELYGGDGRLKMARSLERMWPGVVETKRRFQRPQHVIKDSWRKFDTPLILKPGIDLKTLPEVDEYGMKMTELQPIKHEAMKALKKHYEDKHGG
jgi:hypothetical protein